jgi:N-acyl amino acid synthase of PEP-CTERM/exosortase system
MVTIAQNDTGFAPYFRSRVVDPRQDVELMTKIRRLRYEVYCLECNFLSPADYPDGLETDAFDDISAHFCAFDLKGELAGYVRLVNPDASGRLPFQDHCSEIFPETRLPVPQDSGEISRLMVPQNYRRRRNDTLAGVTAGSEPMVAGERRNSSPQIMLSMYREMYHYSIDHDVRYWYAAMERFLGRTLAMMGFAFKPIGPETDYYGPVAPYLADLRELEEQVDKTCPELLDWFKSRDS